MVAPCVPVGLKPVVLPCWSATLQVLRDSEYMEWGRTRSRLLNFFRVRGSPWGREVGELVLVGEVGEREGEGEERREEEEEGWSGEVGGETAGGWDFVEWRACM